MEISCSCDQSGKNTNLAIWFLNLHCSESLWRHFKKCLTIIKNWSSLGSWSRVFFIFVFLSLCCSISSVLFHQWWFQFSNKWFKTRDIHYHRQGLPWWIWQPSKAEFPRETQLSIFGKKINENNCLIKKDRSQLEIHFKTWTNVNREGTVGGSKTKISLANLSYAFQKNQDFLRFQHLCLNTIQMVSRL